MCIFVWTCLTCFALPCPDKVMRVSLCIPIWLGAEDGEIACSVRGRSQSHAERGGVYSSVACCMVDFALVMSVLWYRDLNRLSSAAVVVVGRCALLESWQAVNQQVGLYEIGCSPAMIYM
jgi:hypothetical protein